MGGHRYRLGAAALAGAALLATAMGATACQPSDSSTDGSAAAADQTGRSTQDNAGAGSGQGGPAASGGAATSDAGQPPATRQFPNTSLFVQLVGYDDAQKMVRFRKVTPIKGDDGTGGQSIKYYEPDANDPTTHRLPMAEQAEVEVSSGPDTCPQQGCTGDEKITVLLQRDGQPCAMIHVDGDDRIDNVSEDVIGMGGDAPPPQD